MKKFTPLIALIQLLFYIVYTVIAIEERKTHSLSFDWTDEGYIFKQPIQTRLYQQYTQITTPNVNEIGGLCDRPNQQNNNLVQLFNTPFSYYFTPNDYISFYGSILSKKEDCTIRVNVTISQSPSQLDTHPMLDPFFSEGLAILSETSDTQLYRNFYNIFGPWVATNIEYGDSSMMTSFLTTHIGINQSSVSKYETLVPMKQLKNAPFWLRNGKFVNFKILTLANFVDMFNLAPKQVVDNLQKLQTESLVANLAQVQSLYQSAYSTYQICENVRLFNLIEANLDTGFQTLIVTYAIQSYKITLDQIKKQYQNGIFSTIKLTSLATLSLDKTRLTDVTIYRIDRAATSTIRETMLTTSESEANSIGSSYSILGYCSSVAHPDMIPLYRFIFNRHYYRTNEKGDQPGWIRESLLCFVYPSQSITAENICILK